MNLLLIIMVIGALSSITCGILLRIIKRRKYENCERLYKYAKFLSLFTSIICLIMGFIFILGSAYFLATLWHIIAIVWGYNFIKA